MLLYLLPKKEYLEKALHKKETEKEPYVNANCLKNMLQNIEKLEKLEEF